MRYHSMRSTHVPKACITGEACITHKVRIMFQKERITEKKKTFCPETKGLFFGGLSQINPRFYRGK